MHIVGFCQSVGKGSDGREALLIGQDTKAAIR